MSDDNEERVAPRALPKRTGGRELIYKQKELELLLKKQELLDQLPHLYGQKLYKWQRAYLDSRNRMNLLCSANQVGKAQPVDTLVVTPLGWRELGEIQKGDEVFGLDGKPTKVIDVPYVGTRPVYEICFSDGTKAYASEEHLWVCKDYEGRFRVKGPRFGQWVTKTTGEIIRDGKYAYTTTAPLRHVIPVCEPVEYVGGELFDPYYVGLYLGNGYSCVLTFNELDGDLIEHAARYGNRRARGGAVGVRKDVLDKLTLLGVTEISYNKKIPAHYMLGTIEQRKALLAGLLDTDGYCSLKGTDVEFSSTSEVLANQVIELVCSLGGIAQIKKKKSSYRKEGVRIDCRDHFVVKIWATFNPFRSLRKSARWRPVLKYRHERVIVSITPAGEARVKCLTVDNSTGTFLVTRNYVVTHNSTVNIKKCITWATSPELWGELWSRRPTQFWYMYPSKDMASTEFENKWLEQMPRGEAAKSKRYGFEVEKDKGDIYAIHWNTGVHVYFKTYSQDKKYLQGSTVFSIFADEEMPEGIFDELMFRLAATSGYFHMVFTATLGQKLWWSAMEEKGEKEKFVDAFKQQISMYDCTEYEDGTPGVWSVEKIREQEARCRNKNEILRRIYGRFVTDEGLKYPTFDASRHFKKPHEIPNSWLKYAAIDYGSGGESGHRAAILFLAVHPDRRVGRVFKAWRGDGVSTTAGDVLKKYVEMKEGMQSLVKTVYDPACKDLGELASRTGLTITPANKRHQVGEDILNTLFKNDMIKLYDTEEIRKLGSELASLRQTTAKQNAEDDLVDCLRYVCVEPPWDFSGLGLDILTDIQEPQAETELDARRRFVMEGEKKIEDEFEEWNDHYDGY